jgi:hypothetical protein
MKKIPTAETKKVLETEKKREGGRKAGQRGAWKNIPTAEKKRVRETEEERVRET